MANEQPTDLASGSIEDFLLSLADGIHKAQRQLSQMSIAVQAGQPAITYQLPRVDFEFRVAFELASRSAGDAPGAGHSSMRLRPPATGGAASRDASASATSLIKGSFVAVPAQGGKPPPVMKLALKRVSGRRLQLQVIVSSVAGEKLEGVRVEFNVDRELSKKLNASFGDNSPLRPATNVWAGLVSTDADGIAATSLVVDAAEEPGKRVAVLIDALSETQTVVFTVEAE